MDSSTKDNTEERVTSDTDDESNTTMKEKEGPTEQWRNQHLTHGSVTVTNQSWMSKSARKDWDAAKWRKLHNRDSEKIEMAKHSNATMQRQLEETTRLLEKQKRIVDKQHTSLQRQLLTGNLRTRLKLRNSRQEKAEQDTATSRANSSSSSLSFFVKNTAMWRKCQSHDDLRSSVEFESEETFSIGNFEDDDDDYDFAGIRGLYKPRSMTFSGGRSVMTADGRSRSPRASSPLRNRAHTMDNMFLASKTKSGSEQNLSRMKASSKDNLKTHTNLDIRKSTSNSHLQSSSTERLRPNTSANSKVRKSNSNSHLPDIHNDKNPTFVSKWASTTDVSETPRKEKWLTELVNKLPPDLYAESQANSRMRREKRLKRMLSRSYEDCRGLGTEDSRFLNLTSVLVKQ